MTFYYSVFIGPKLQAFEERKYSATVLLILMAEITISPKTRFFEGVFNGFKFGIAHSLFYAPFVAKEHSLETGVDHRKVYRAHCLKAFGFYTVVLGSTHFLRQLVVDKQDTILFELQYRAPFFRQNKAAGNILLCSLFTWPLGISFNYLNTGRLFRGTFFYTMFLTLCVFSLQLENGRLR